MTQSLDMKVDNHYFRHFIKFSFADHLTIPHTYMNDKCNIISNLLQTSFILTSAPSSTKTFISSIIYTRYVWMCLITWYMQTELSTHHTEECGTTLLSVLCLHNKHASKNGPAAPCFCDKCYTSEMCCQTWQWCCRKLIQGLVTVYR